MPSLPCSVPARVRAAAPALIAFVTVLTAVAVAPAAARAATLSVPADHPTLQQAVRAAAPGDEIRLATGRHCGAVVDKRLIIVGQPGATIAGCDSNPRLHDQLRIGLLLEDADGSNPASGSTVTGLIFDGEGVTNDNLEPLAFGLFARFADDVVVTGNHFLGTVQAITNTAGRRWTITGNRILGLGVFADCQRTCGGGSAIVVQDASDAVALPGGSLNPRNRPAENTVADNQVEVLARPGFDQFGLAGVLVLGADRTVVFGNRLAIPGDDQPGDHLPDGDVTGVGVLVDNQRAGQTTVSLPGSRETTVEENDGRASQRAVVVVGGKGVNTDGLIVERNQGAVSLETRVRP
jgi:hypothetical protein